MARRPTILIIDDIEYYRAQNAEIIVRALPDAAVVFARDGREGLTAAQGSRPDVVVTDLSMPVMNGLDMIHAIRRDKSLAGVPIIVVTNLESEGMRHEALTTGATAFVGKSEVEEKLAGVVRELLTGRGEEAEPDAGEP